VILISLISIAELALLPVPESLMAFNNSNSLTLVNVLYALPNNVKSMVVVFKSSLICFTPEAIIKVTIIEPSYSAEDDIALTVTLLIDEPLSTHGCGQTKDKSLRTLVSYPDCKLGSKTLVQIEPSSTGLSLGIARFLSFINFSLPFKVEAPKTADKGVLLAVGAITPTPHKTPTVVPPTASSDSGKMHPQTNILFL
jgi:hypothetical protein